MLTVVLLTATAVYGVVNLIKVDNSIELFTPEGDESLTILEELKDSFGRHDPFLIVASGDVFSPSYLNRLEVLHEEVSNLNLDLTTLDERRVDRLAAEAPHAPKDAAPSADDAFGDFDTFEDIDADQAWEGESEGTAVDDVLSLVNARRTVMDGETLKVGTWFEAKETFETLDQWRAEVMSDKTLKGNLISQDGTHSLIVVKARFMSVEDHDRFHDALEALLTQHIEEGFELTLGGAPAIDSTFNRLMLKDMVILLLAAIIIMGLILTYLFRRLVAILAPIAAVSLAVLWTLGSMAYLGLAVGMISSMLPAFIFVVGVGDSVHLLSVYRTERLLGTHNREAIVRAVARTGQPVLLTTLTTAIGLFSFEMASVVAIQELGLAGGIGVVMAMLTTLTILPVCLFWFAGTTSQYQPTKRVDPIDRFLVGCFSLSKPTTAHPTRRRTRTLIVSSIAVVIGIYGITDLKVGHDPIYWFGEDVPVRQASFLLDEEFKGSMRTSILIRAPGERGIKDRELLVALEAFEAHLLAFEDPKTGRQMVGGVTSIVDIVKETHRALLGEEDNYRIPDTERGVSDMLFLFENAGPQQLRDFATIDLKKTVMQVACEGREASEYGPFIAHIKAGIQTHFTPLGAEHVSVALTGGVPMFYSVVTSLIDDLIRSFGTALALITLMMIGFLGSFKLGLLAMVPNLTPIVLVTGFMGYAGIEVDLNNLLIASIVIGIAVDDTIHLLHHIRHHLDRGESVETALEYSRRDAGKAVVSTSLILMAGFFCFTAGSTLPLMRFGLLASLAITMALAVDLVALPALLRLVYTKRPSLKAASLHAD